VDGRSRNPFIAAIFHETNLAETKGSGIATMRRLMNAAGLVPTTFESDHANNQFTARLLLHHFLSEEDLVWLNLFDDFALNDDQRKILVFLRETGAVDNTTYRQLSGCDTLKASADLRSMRDAGLLEAKGRGRATYYIPGEVFWLHTAPVQELSAPVQELSAPVPVQVPGLIEPVTSSLVNQLPPELRPLLDDLGQKCRDVNKMQQFIHELCRWRNLKLIEIAAVLDRQPKYVLRKFIQPMLKKSLIKYTFPDMPNHPEQAYTVNI
jgi:ATP-dependent DNA helicase RecG